MTTSTLLWFLSASVALTLAPGPDNTFIVSQGIARGRKAAFASAMGMCSGVSVHTTAAALGISAALYSSALAFAILKYAGVAYLLFLAWKSLGETGAPDTAVAMEGSLTGWAFFRRGFLMNVVNPKVGMFFLAFLPQFVSKSGGSVPVQMFTLGVIFMLQAVAVFALIAYLSGSVGVLIQKRPGISKYFAWLTAGIFASLGLKLALAQR